MTSYRSYAAAEDAIAESGVRVGDEVMGGGRVVRMYGCTTGRGGWEPIAEIEYADGHMTAPRLESVIVVGGGRNLLRDRAMARG